MLTIKKHPLSTKATLLGSIAFLVGLTGAGAYVERFRQHENLVFGHEGTVLGASDSRPAPQQGSSADKAQKTTSSSSSEAISPQITNSPIGAADAEPPSVAAEPVAVSSTPTLTPGRGGGAVASPTTSSPSTSPTEDDSGSTTDVLQVVDELLEPIVTPLIP